MLTTTIDDVSRRLRNIEKVLELGLTTREVSAISGHTPGTLRTYRATGRGPKFFKTAEGGVRYRVSDVEEWLTAVGGGCVE